MEIKYLRELQIQKELIIANQAIAIEALQNHNKFLMNNHSSSKKNVIQVHDDKNVDNSNDENKQYKHVSKIQHSSTKPVVRSQDRNMKSTGGGTSIRRSVTDEPCGLTVTRNQNKNNDDHLFTVRQLNEAIENAQEVNARNAIIHSNIALPVDIEKSTPSKNEWTDVNYKKPKRKSKSTLVVGSCSGDSTVEGIEKMKFLHVSNLKPDTTADNLLKFLNRNFSNQVKCEPLKSRFPESYSSFKVTILDSEYDKALVPTNWPNRANVRVFFHRRPMKQDQQLN
ncbi:uncharacterized protein LOC123317229 [Coccinella septempunctata]|uniref:uncharacterized protein LOC123317229 n=1 Tax=Coccinella septempunctata TaxID=41139 RepID=UPI001D0814D3|nr:uncharacterized protein LOC123317229 [Coccinella septempunctata]